MLNIGLKMCPAPIIGAPLYLEMTIVWVSHVPVIVRDPPIPPSLASSPSHHWNSKGRCQPRCDDDEMEEVWCSQFQKCQLLLIRAPWLCCTSSEWLLSPDPWQQCADYKVMYQGIAGSWPSGDDLEKDIFKRQSYVEMSRRLNWFLPCFIRTVRRTEGPQRLNSYIIHLFLFQALKQWLIGDALLTHKETTTQS